VADDLGTDLHQVLFEARQRPFTERRRDRQCPHEVAEVVGERMKLKADGVGGHRQVLFDLWGDTVNTAARVTICAKVNSVFLSDANLEFDMRALPGQSRGGEGQLVECHAVDV
jgi:hypothetical protein